MSRTAKLNSQGFAIVGARMQQNKMQWTFRFRTKFHLKPANKVLKIMFTFHASAVEIRRNSAKLGKLHLTFDTCREEQSRGERERKAHIFHCRLKTDGESKHIRISDQAPSISNERRQIHWERQLEIGQRKLFHLGAWKLSRTDPHATFRSDLQPAKWITEARARLKATHHHRKNVNSLRNRRTSSSNDSSCLQRSNYWLSWKPDNPNLNEMETMKTKRKKFSWITFLDKSETKPISCRFISLTVH